MHQYLKDAAVVSITPISTSGTPGVVVLTATAADVKFIFTPPRPIDVIRWGVIYTVAKDATSMALTLSRRPTAGLAAGKTVISTLTDTAARAAGAVTYVEPGTLTTVAATQQVGEDGAQRNVDPVGAYHVAMGQELSIELTDVADVSGQGYLFIEFVEYPFNPADVGIATAAVKLASST